MKHRSRYIGYVGILLTAFAIGLFALAFFLNLSHKETSLSSIRASLREDLEKGSVLLEQAIMMAETGYSGKPDLDNHLSFSLKPSVSDGKWTTLDPETFSNVQTNHSKNHFFSIFQQVAFNATHNASMENSPAFEGDVIPSMLEPFFLLERKDNEAAVDAFNKGLAAKRNGQSESAIQWFHKAQHILPRNQDELYMEICSHLYQVELNAETDTRHLHYLLYLMYDSKGVRLDRTTIRFLEQRLRQNVNIPDFDHLLKTNRKMMKQADMVNRHIRKAEFFPFRSVFGKHQILSARQLNRVYIINFNWNNYLPEHTIFQWGTKPEATFITYPLDILPGASIGFPRSVYDEQSTSVQHQFILVNSVLVVLSALISTLAIGVIHFFRRENELTRLRADFIATVSHELRTPLSLIQLYAETLYLGRIPKEKSRQYLQTLIAETERMTGLVNNVVDYSRLGSNQKVISREPTNLSNLCKNVAHVFQYRIEKEQIEFHEQIAPEITANIDPQLFSQVIFNLIDNAIKYAGTGKYIQLSLAQTGQHIELRVTDRGIGIPAEAKKHIFEDFYRANDPRVSRQRGSGIGLSIVKTLLTRMECTIRLEDAAPCGSVFIVSLPVLKEKP